MTNSNYKLTKEDFNQINKRSLFTFQLGWNYERMQGLGYLTTMLPLIEKLYGDQPALKKKALQAHSVFFNTTPAMGDIIVGMNVAIEEEMQENGAGIDVASSMKTALMGPLSGIGDTFFWGTFRIIASGVGISLASQGSILGPLIFLIIYNIPHILVRVFGLKYGYKLGSSSIDALVKGGLMAKATLAATVLGLVVVGGMIASMVTVNVAFVADFGSGMTLSVQEVLDQLCPCLLPLVLTFGIYHLLKKDVKPWVIMVALFALGIVGKFIGIF